MEDFNEYITFNMPTKDGREIELAVVDEFEFERKTYVVAALVEGDTINEDALFIYRSIVKGEDFTIEKIEDAGEYERISNAYLELDKDEE